MLLLWACVDYGLEGEEPAPTAPAPAIRVEPTTVDLGVVCGGEATTVAVHNDGTADLVVSDVSLDARGWTLEDLALPATIGPGAALAVALHATPGHGTLAVESDDPARPIVDVSLIASANVGPVATILAPSEDEFISPAGDYLLRAQLSDDDDDVTGLTVTWTSALTGVVGTAIADADGIVETLWPAEARASGPQTIQVAATDSCADVGEQTVYFCQEGAFATEALETDAWHVEGTASVTGGVASLDPGTGSAFDAFAIFDAGELTLQFEMLLDGTGEGVAVVLLAEDSRTDWLGGDACGMGFGGGVDCTAGPALPGLALAFDTDDDPGADCILGDELAVYADGDLNRPLACVTLPEIDDAAWHSVGISIAAPEVSVTLDGELLLAVTPAIEGFPARIGFTSSGTGRSQVRGLLATDFGCAF